MLCAHNDNHITLTWRCLVETYDALRVIFSTSFATCKAAAAAVNVCWTAAESSSERSSVATCNMQRSQTISLRHSTYRQTTCMTDFIVICIKYTVSPDTFPNSPLTPFTLTNHCKMFWVPSCWIFSVEPRILRAGNFDMWMNGKTHYTLVPTPFTRQTTKYLSHGTDTKLFASISNKLF